MAKQQRKDKSTKHLDEANSPHLLSRDEFDHSDSKLDNRVDGARSMHGHILSLQRLAGNAAVTDLCRRDTRSPLSPETSMSPPAVQRVPPVPPPTSAIPGVGLAIGAATFALNFRPSGVDAFQNTNVQFNYSRDTPGPHPPRESRRMIFQLGTIKGLGSSFAFLEVVLRYDGHNIVSAYTEQDQVRGYDGGMFGSEASVNFSAVKSSQPTDPITEAYILVQGFNNPSGPGFQRYHAKILVTGDGRVEPLECALSSGDGVARTSPWCYVGW